MKILYFDCAMGAAGDMLAAALLELHPAPEDFLRRLNEALPERVRVSAEADEKRGIRGTHLRVLIDGEEEGHEQGHTHAHTSVKEILARIADLDYPPDKLDVKLLLEADDSETRGAIARTELPPWCEVIDIPGEGRIRTKPRACNYGLKAARGEYLVIYDAEDEPEPDQLKKALCLFSRPGTEDLVCVQAKLNFYNADQNLLTKLFTVEYSTHFGLLLPGLQLFRLPLPLGGTSNHFRTEDLRKLNGWDPFNVTEDCDLGIRIFEQGGRTEVMESTTWEEANPKIGNWLRQRSRWVKGYLQTHLVHYRNPFLTMKRLGVRGFFGCYSFVGGTVLMMLANLVYWPLLLLYALLLAAALCSDRSLLSVIAGPQSGVIPGIGSGAWRLSAWPLFYTGPGEDPLLSRLSVLFFCGGVFLFLTNFLLIAVHSAACVRCRFYRLIPYSFLMPFYWVLISLGAWMGVLQFIRRPFYWEKTRHGLDLKKSGKPAGSKGGIRK